MHRRSRAWLILAGVSCLWLPATNASAQPGPGDAQGARGILRSLEVDATAIRGTSLTMDAVAVTAARMRNDVDQLPLLLAVRSPEVSAIEVSMRAHIARLVEVAGYPDRFLSAGAADDLLGDIARLRDAAALPR
jgi:hypothetical protein